jgi:hypothetical protein
MAGEGLFFTGTILKNNRDLLKEEAARQQLELQREELELRKQQAADRRRENRRKNAPKFEAFDQSAVGDFVAGTKRDVNSYIGWVSNNYESDTPEYYSNRAKLKTNLVSDIGLLSKITSDYDSKMQDLAKGGDALDRANYVRNNETGSYEFEDRKERLVQQYNANEITAEEAYAQYFNNDGQSLYLVREKSSLGQGIVDSYIGPKDSYLDDSDDGKREIRGYTNSSRKAVYESFKNELKFNDKGVFETPQGEIAYFKSTGEDNELNMVLFFNEEEGKLTVDENSPILNKLDPKSEDFDPELSGRYVDYLARVQTDPFMVNEVVLKSKSKQESNFENAVDQSNWDTMMNDKEMTDVSYGTHGRMLSNYNFTQNVGGEHDIQASTLNNMQVSSRPVNKDGVVLDTETAKKYLLTQINQDGGKIKSKLSQVAISEDHTNMYGIYSIPISNESSGGKGSMDIEISVPIRNLSGLKFGEAPSQWITSMNANREGLYTQEQETTETTGVSAPRP